MKIKNARSGCLLFEKNKIKIIIIINKRKKGRKKKNQFYTGDNQKITIGL